MSETWPDPHADYQFPGGDNEKKERWAKAVKDALASGGLQLEHQSEDLYSLRGSCPRCGHGTSQVIDFSIYAPKEFIFRRRAQASPLTLDVVCSCSCAHGGRGEGATGCGWGRGLPVSIDHPSAGA